MQQNVNINITKKLMFTIWVLAKPESFLAASDRFGLPKSTGHKIFRNITHSLVQLMPQYIKWPNAAQKQLSCNIFEARSRGFPGVIGAIDGCHIPCKQPIGNANDFYNRKSFHSIILQGVCDHRGLFIDCFIGMPGRMHDARVFRNSPLFHQISNAERPLIPENMHLIGDSAYPLLYNVMTPVRDNGHLTFSQRVYNTKLSSIRSIIERAFGLLKNKFRRLKYLDISDFNLGNDMIAAACVLHNFIIIHDGINVEEEDDFFNEANIEIDDIVHEEGLQAVQKRTQIIELF
ncbi:putative nuclease HARBI1 [Formica exsecta]|nr:putative nuclease HARBI1 [Formica exsecta]XP_029673489.1 putative nuclease HARBI1 [Formica exsecta]